MFYVVVAVGVVGVVDILLLVIYHYRCIILITALHFAHYFAIGSAPEPRLLFGRRIGVCDTAASDWMESASPLQHMAEPWLLKFHGKVDIASNAIYWTADEGMGDYDAPIYNVLEIGLLD